MTTWILAMAAALLAAPASAAKLERDGWSLQAPKRCTPKIEHVDARPTYDAQALADYARDRLYRRKPDFYDMPAHLRFDLGTCYGEPGLFDASLRVLPVAEYYRILDDGRERSKYMEQGFAELRDWISGKPDAVAKWPMIPYLDLSPQFTVQRRALRFRGGHGIRVVTQFVPDVGFANSRSISYVFQGLSDDGRTFVLLTVPLTLEGAAADRAETHLGFTYDEIEKPEGAQRYEKAVAALVEKNGTTPALAELDALVESVVAPGNRRAQ